MPKTILITGAAGFIGSHLSEALLAQGHKVVGVDNFDPFYDRSIKEKNLSELLPHPNFRLIECDIVDGGRLEKHLSDVLGDACDAIVHIAAKAGVRPSIEDPVAYQETNVRGTQNLLELARKLKVPQFVFASSSSVYGVNPRVPWSESDAVLQPISPYASTKVSGELLGHVYSHLYGIRFVGLRFFTVYGPRQRPDLAINKFTRLILEEQAIPFFGSGETRRDYTFVKDTVQGIIQAINYTGSAYELINLGNNQTVSLNELVAGLEEALGKKAILNRLPEQPGDVPQTWADISKAKKLLGYAPQTGIKEGLKAFAAWYRQN